MYVVTKHMKIIHAWKLNKQKLQTKHVCFAALELKLHPATMHFISLSGGGFAMFLLSPPKYGLGLLRLLPSRQSLFCLVKKSDFCETTPTQTTCNAVSFTCRLRYVIYSIG